MDIQTYARLRDAEAGSEIPVTGAVIVAISMPYPATGDTCGACPVGHDDCELLYLYKTCIKKGLIFRVKQDAAGDGK